MCRKMVFEAEARIGLMYFQMKDLEPSVYIDAAIVMISLRRRHCSKCLSFQQKDILTKYLKAVDYPKGRDFDGVMPYRLEIE
ncbi:hypothetical protein Hanom_Chr06g00540441 [Helianthus anomalus]